MIPEQFTQQLAEIEAMLTRSRATTSAVQTKLATRAPHPALSNSRVAPDRVDAPLPCATRPDPFVEQVARRWRVGAR